MALSPIADDVEYTSPTQEDVTPISMRTYALDLDTGEIGGIINGESAIRQFIRKAVLTSRFRFSIYDDDYGCELDDLIGRDVSFEFLQTEIPRVVTEALIFDDRIKDVTNFDIQRESDKLYISFHVQLTDGNGLDDKVVI